MLIPETVDKILEDIRSKASLLDKNKNNPIYWLYASQWMYLKKEHFDMIDEENIGKTIRTKDTIFK